MNNRCFEHSRFLTLFPFHCIMLVVSKSFMMNKENAYCSTLFITFVKIKVTISALREATCVFFGLKNFDATSCIVKVFCNYFYSLKFFYILFFPMTSIEFNIIKVFFKLKYYNIVLLYIEFAKRHVFRYFESLILTNLLKVKPVFFQDY